MTDEVALWKQRILQRKANRQTIVEWCREHNVTKGSYHYWRRQVIKAEGSATEHTANTEPVLFAKSDRADFPCLRGRGFQKAGGFAGGYCEYAVSP